MRVLFISSGNSTEGISPIVKNQGESLIRLKLEVQYFTISGKGIKGYLNNIIKLRKHLRTGNFDIIHAHYALVGIVAFLAGARPLVVSLMGSDVFEFRWLRVLTRFFARFFWSVTIVKSEGLKKKLHYSKAVVVPNGVSFERFRPMDEDELRVKLPSSEKPLVIFLGNPAKREKNLPLAREAVEKISDVDFEFKPLFNIDNELIPYYMNRAKVLLMTSLWEGSPNVIKEAMACDLCVVSVDVGDVREVIGDTKGCYVTFHDPADIAEKLRLAIRYPGKTNGREKIAHLNSENVANRIKQIYLSLLK